jgi:hypothetical protein
MIRTTASNALAIAATSGRSGRALARREQAPPMHRRDAIDPPSKLSMRHAKIDAKAGE